MSRLAKVAFALSFFLLADAFSCHACTSVIISGKITEDGRTAARRTERSDRQRP
ncbi:MAG: hypothetical protein IJL56_03285 [Bacteroidales bacterium]|nr:hypothetical protein [Bacteroidales bacterium]